MMNFNHLRVFLAVAKHLSFSRAAEELFISQSTVSIQVKKLELDLGLDLFEQLGKQIYLTAAGEILMAYATRIYAMAEEAEVALRELTGLHSGRLIIGASSTPGIYVLPGLIGSFQKMHPGLNISLEISNTHAVQEQLLANQIDLGIVGEELAIDPRLHVEAFREDELIIIVAAGHPFAGRQSVYLEELQQEKLILRERGSSTREVLEEKVRSRSGHLNVVMQLSTVEAIKQAVAANLGLSIISRLAVALEVQTGVLHTLNVKDLQLVRQISLVYHREKRISSAMKNFLKHLQNKK